MHHCNLNRQKIKIERTITYKMNELNSKIQNTTMKRILQWVKRKTIQSKKRIIYNIIEQHGDRMKNYIETK